MGAVVGQYYLRIDLNNLTDFILESELQELAIIEEAGGALPIFRCTFNSFNNDIFKHLHEGAVLRILFGSSRQNLIASEIVVTKVNFGKRGDAGFAVALEGVFNRLSYLTNIKQRVSEETSAIEEITNVAKNYFTISSDFKKSEDKQRWIQASVSDKSHITSVWLHGNYKDDICLIGITTQGLFRIKSLKNMIKDCKNCMVLTTTENNPSKNIYAIGSNYQVNFDSFTTNFLGGYGKKLIKYDLVKDTEETFIGDPMPILTMNDKRNRNKTVDKLFDGVYFRTQNVHDTFYESKNLNMANIFSLHTYTIQAEIDAIYCPVSILDLVFFRDNVQNSRVGETNLTGYYVVSRVERQIKNRMFRTIVTLHKDALNDFVEGGNNGVNKRI